MDTVTILSLLDVYSEIHEAAETRQKACIWQLTKARQNKGRRGALMDGVLLADDVREELRATTILKEIDIMHHHEEPSLVTEESKKAPLGDDLSLVGRAFSLTNAADYLKEQQQLQNKTQTDNSDEPVNDKNKQDDQALGLRRRKGNDNTMESLTSDDEKNKKSTNTSEWAIVESVDEKKEEMSEEERLRQADPLDFFGAMPPQELRKAQAEAQKALALYVEAANMVAAIQKCMKETKRWPHDNGKLGSPTTKLLKIN